MIYQRKEIIGDCTLYLGDCLEVLPTLEKVDAVVTDPPYGIGVDMTMAKKAGQKYGKAAAKKSTYEGTGWDDDTADEGVSAAISAATHSIIFGGNYYDLPPSSCWLVWDKQNGATDFADCELAWTNLKKAVRKIEWRWNGMLRRGDDIRLHPTQKPVGVMTWCIEQLPDDCTTILDPFMGSGTTIVACAKMGRKGIGIERESKYFDIACRRVEETYKQADLFIPAPSQPAYQQNELHIPPATSEDYP